MTVTPETAEEFSAKLPALHTLLSMGWTYLSPEKCMAMRGSALEVVLVDVLMSELRKRTFDYKGQARSLSDDGIAQIVRELTTPAMHDGLLVANEKLYGAWTLGVTVTEFIDGKKYSPTIPIINWDEPEENSFVVTEELEVLRSGGVSTRRPDIVCYVNGLPLVVIEAKRPDSGNPNKSMVEEGISQNIRNQKPDEIPKLFAYAQLLMAISATDGKYATARTPKKFWSGWREELLDEAHFTTIKNKPISASEKDGLFAHRPSEVRKYFESLWAAPQLPTGQDRMLISLLSKDRLLEFIRFFILFDQKVGKVAARYQQVFGIKALIDQMNKKKAGGGREGGVIWHTTGSGKSFTMVFLCKALLLHESLKDCRVLVVTDRTDLEKQLARTFLSGGAFGSEIASKKEGEKSKVSSGRDLAKRIGQGAERIIFTIIDKFRTASKLPECKNESENLIVLVDEGHRSHSGENHQRMRAALPNASYIAFTGTPLLKDDKTRNKFGRIIHHYTMQRAVEDGTVTPLLYEERKPELEVNAKAIDNWFDKITTSLSEKQKSDLKQKWGRKGPVYGSANRIELIAWDIAIHFDQNFKSLGQGLKGQLATDSKLSAIRYKRALDQTGLVTSDVIISPPDTREGHSDVDENELPEVQQWWKDNVGPDWEVRERRVIDDFSTEGRPDILIVVDKLLTGFDEPRNTVLYIDKPLRQHNLIQAIARVNRLHDAKKFGYLIDYRGILPELDTAIEQYQDLADKTQGGFEITDLEGLIHKVSTEYKKLPHLHECLWTVFASVKNRQDLEQYRQVLVPKYQEDNAGQSYDAHQKVREDFYQALTEFGLCLQVALASRSFFEDPSFSEADIERYKSDLRFFTNLRKIAKQDSQETVDYSTYEEQIRRLVDKHVVGSHIADPEGVILVEELGKSTDPETWSKEKTRNETDIIKSRLKKTIEQELADDPYAQLVFSQLLRQAIAEAESMFDFPHKQYVLFKDLDERLKKREVETMPDAFAGNRHAQAYYGTFRLAMGDAHFAGFKNGEDKAFIDEAHAIDRTVRSAIAEYSLNPQNIEAQIRKELLPRLYDLIGLDKAKDVIERVIQITRVGLSRGNLSA
ncbi:type I restriction endonuclease subunit R [Bradyrhizobium sp. 2TAF36]|uniref:type I restriction endonuclease subunit R n=1 Tax=Bradyrhizobium sp. 2TAF36 TaxID=3233016 RepID=UPI003F9364EC